MCKDLVVWAPDDVLAEYAMYFNKRAPESKLKDFEIHFGKAILAYRRELGFKNKKITPEQITVIFKAGWGDKRLL